MAKKILIIDDELDMVEVTKVRLEKSGYEVLNTMSGEEALVLLQKNIPDLILLDRVLPKMQGEEVCKQLKGDAKLRHIPIILFTANISDIVQEAQESGADDYIIKPYEPKEFLEKIRKFIG